ncbi:PR-1-like protein [Xylariaceae sp. FL0662B]|nr:PR-1-like protein [Xylariaceae sp. FL0662B]
MLTMSWLSGVVWAGKPQFEALSRPHTMIVPSICLPNGIPFRPILALIHLSLVAHLVSCQSVVVVTVAPAIPSTAPEFVDGPTFTSAILNSTNTYRAAYNASSLVWNKTLEAFASDYLNLTDQQTTQSRRRSEPRPRPQPLPLQPRAQDEDEDEDEENCTFAHSGGPYGENLAIGCANATSCVQAWGDEAAQYDFDDPGFAEATGHFTQLVWKTTTAVGCARRLCARSSSSSSGWYLVCEYWPRGNVIGAFADEVDAPVNGAAAGLRGPGKGCVVVVVVVGLVMGFYGLEDGLALFG